MSLIEPIDHRLKVDTQRSTYGSEAHALQAQLYGLQTQCWIIPHRLLVGCEVPLASFTPHSFAAGMVSA